jgi:hypothetical protein
MAFVAPGGHHLLVRRDREGLFAELILRGPDDKYVPSADRMMISVSDACGAAALGVVLTGMGNDGARGALAIKKQQGQCLAESEESAVIFDAPGRSAPALSIRSCPWRKWPKRSRPVAQEGVAARRPCPDTGNTLDKLIHLVYNYLRFTMADTAQIRRGNGTTPCFLPCRRRTGYAAGVKG